jgi:peroxiredoxin (alkyl hydroperoxide reductase subunit C)
MLADPNGKFARAMDVLNEQTGLALRGTFVVDPEGLIKVVEITDDGIGRSAAETLRKLQAAKFVREHGEVCPANWRPGQKTLKPGKELVGKI